jgi:hypothetical protein
MGFIGDLINAAANLVHDVVVWLQSLAPGGFGLLLIPLGILGVISLLVARNR